MLLPRHTHICQRLIGVREKKNPRMHTHASCERGLAVTRQAVRAKVQTNWVITHSSKTHGRNDGQDENELWE